MQRVKAHVIPARHRLTSQIIVWIGRIKLLRMTGAIFSRVSKTVGTPTRTLINCLDSGS